MNNISHKDCNIPSGMHPQQGARPVLSGIYNAAFLFLELQILPHKLKNRNTEAIKDSLTDIKKYIVSDKFFEFNDDGTLKTTKDGFPIIAKSLTRTDGSALTAKNKGALIRLMHVVMMANGNGINDIQNFQEIITYAFTNEVLINNEYVNMAKELNEIDGGLRNKGRKKSLLSNIVDFILRIFGINLENNTILNTEVILTFSHC